MKKKIQYLWWIFEVVHVIPYIQTNRTFLNCNVNNKSKIGFMWNFMRYIIIYPNYSYSGGPSAIILGIPFTFPLYPTPQNRKSRLAFQSLRCFVCGNFELKYYLWSQPHGQLDKGKTAIPVLVRSAELSIVVFKTNKRSLMPNISFQENICIFSVSTLEY